VPTFAPIDHAARVATLQRMLGAGDLGVDALLFVDLLDVRWLTGFTGSNGWVVVRPDEVLLGTDTRYGDRAAAETDGSGVEVVALQHRPDLHAALIAAAGLGEVGVDGGSLTHTRWGQLASDLSLVSVTSPVGTAREVKDAPEIERIEAAAAAADAALAEVEPLLFGTLDDPVTEADIRDELEYRMRRHGADDRSYETIVASGPDHAARPHHEVGRRTIVEGDTIVIDVGALVDGYHSDMTRSYVVGEPTAQQREIYELVQRSHTAGLESLRTGVTAAAVDSACRDVFVEAGYGDWYLHGTGHGVGLQIHESPFHSQASDEVIRAGNVVTIEPGLYRGGFGGIRIEDLVVVTTDGYRVLTHHPKQPFDER
jgi:Xaa-Pro aminopeptidase